MTSVNFSWYGNDWLRQFKASNVRKMHRATRHLVNRTKANISVPTYREVKRGKAKANNSKVSKRKKVTKTKDKKRKKK